MKNFYTSFLFNVFMWAGSKLFKVVAIYPNGGEIVEVCHWAISEQALAKSCHEFSENSVK